LYTGTPPSGGCCPINTPTLSGPVTLRHTLTSGTGTDAFGNFPIVAPGGGVYSLKLGNMYGGAEAERARYYVTVPSGVNNYSVIFRYAVVFEDPGHPASDQPRFEVKAFDSLTNTVIPCTQFTYVATSNLPGFSRSTADTMVWYKPWTTASINLSGYAGKKVAIDFASGDCAQGGHFGYGYVDMNCGLFQISGVICSSSPTITLTAPPGFWKYYWKDSTLTHTIDSGQTVTMVTPQVTTKYAVVLVPYTGFGCPDTLYTTVTVTNIPLNATKDTTICQNSSLQLSAGSLTNVGPLTYSWTPSTGLSCTTCANPVASPSTSGSYYITVTDSNGCTKKDTVNIGIDSLSLSLTAQNILCFEGNNGSISTTVNRGKSPYLYSWNTTPAQTGSALNNLTPGSYTVTVTDSFGCKKTDSALITQPTALVTTKSKTDINCFGGNNGTALISASGGTPPYTYSWNTTPVQTTSSISNLSAGSYIVVTTDTKGCSKTDTITITQNGALSITKTKADARCYGGNTGSASITVNNGTSPYTYSWNTTPAQTTSSINNLIAGTYVATVTDARGCTKTDTVTITQPAALNNIKTKTDINCFGANTGTAGVTASGGTTPYSYNWNTIPAQTTATINNLNAGTYIVTITDSNACYKTDTIIITQPTALSNAKTKNDVSCFGGNNGTAGITVSGGTTPYSYSWNTSPAQTTAVISNLNAGMYIATVTDAKGCIKVDTVTISQPTAISNTKTKTDISCFGGNNGTASIIASGGTAPYTYSWNTLPIQTTASINNLGIGTYVVTITDAKNCTKNDTTNIIQSQGITITKSRTNVSCFGGSNGSATANISGGKIPYSYAWNTSPTQNTLTATNLSAGTYTLTVTDSFGCSKSDTVIIAQPSVLSMTKVQNNAGCYGSNSGSAAISANGGTAPYNYSWNTVPAQTTAAIINLSAGNYVITLTDANGCAKTDSVLITQHTQLNTIKSKKNISCFGGNDGTATITATGGIYPYSYSWNTVLVQTTSVATNLSAGTFIVTITDSFGCVKTDTITLNQPAAITSSKTKTDVSCFGGNTGTATINGSGGTQPYTYGWNTTPAQNTATATGLVAGTYVVTLTDSLGCTKNDTVAIAQPPILNTVKSKADVSCFGNNNGSAAINASGGTSPYSYSWNTVPIQTTAAINSLSAGNYIVVLTDAKGCTRQDTIVITQPGALVTIKSKNDVNCFGDSTGVATIAANGGVAPYTYNWNTTPSLATASISKLSAGTYIVVITDSFGCKKSDTVNISQPTALALNQIKKHVSCFGEDDGNLSVNATGGTPPYIYTWNTTPTQTTATITNLKAGSYAITVQDAKGCLVQSIDTITQPDMLVISPAELSKTCYGMANGSALVNISGGTPLYSISWNTYPKQTSDTAINLTSGWHSVTVTDANGCTRSDSLQIDLLPHTAIAVSPDTVICVYQTVKLKAGGAKSYLWTPPSGLSCANCASPLATPQASTVYQVSGTDIYDCPDTGFVNIEVIPKVPVSAGKDMDICIGDSVQLYANGGTSYVWMPNIYLNNNQIAEPVAAPDSSLKYKVIITENKCFQDTLYQSVTVHPRPTIELGPDLEGVPGASFQLQPSVTNATGIKWSPAEGLSCTDCYTPVATVNSTVTYKAIVSNGSICIASDEITIRVACDGTLVFVPNTFTPNGDGLNDRFYPSAKGVNLINVMRVYDRWGELLFEKYNFKPNDEASGWDGTYKFHSLSPDVFVYYLEIQCSNGERTFLKGDISLVK